MRITRDEDHGLTLERVRPGEYGRLGPDPLKQINDYIAFWRAFARDLIEADGKELVQYVKVACDSKTLDLARAAANLLVHLDRVERELELLARGSANAFGLVFQALFTASYVHQLTVVDNENAIAARLHSIEGAQKAYPADSGSSICSRGVDPAWLALFAWIVSLDDVPIARGRFVSGERQQRFE